MRIIDLPPPNLLSCNSNLSKASALLSSHEKSAHAFEIYMEQPFPHSRDNDMRAPAEEAAIGDRSGCAGW